MKMRMKRLAGLVLCIACSVPGSAQKLQRDKHIVYQQERMVFKQWDRSKFTPSKGFLGLNPNYWLTWGLHPNYPRTDRRPLRAGGPQTLRMGLTLAMEQSAGAYKRHTDTLRNTALLEVANYSGLLSASDPLWILYYKGEFDRFNQSGSDPLTGLSPGVRAYLVDKGVLEWFGQELGELQERLDAARRVSLDRGSRILAYHRMLYEHRKLFAAWEGKKSYAVRFLSLVASAAEPSEPAPGAWVAGRPDWQIAEDILRKTQTKKQHNEMD